MNTQRTSGVQPLSKKPRNWIFYYTLSAGSYTENKHAYVRATDVYEALDMAAHKIQFDMLMAPQIRPGAQTYDGYEITSVGTV
jgi:hypothetical protein